MLLSELPPGVLLYNGTSESGVVDLFMPIAAGDSISLTLEFHVLDRRPTFVVEFSLAEQNETQPLPHGPGGMGVDRCILQKDGTFLIEFNSVPGAVYEIQYSDKGVEWITSPVQIRAAGNRVQWIDRGPPRTNSVPGEKGSRFYRVVGISDSLSR